MSNMEDFFVMFTENMTEKNGVRHNPGVLIEKFHGGSTQPVTAIGRHPIILERALNKEWLDGKEPIVVFLCKQCKLGLMCYGHSSSINISHMQNAVIVDQKDIVTAKKPLPPKGQPVFNCIGPDDPCHERNIRQDIFRDNRIAYPGQCKKS